MILNVGSYWSELKKYNFLLQSMILNVGSYWPELKKFNFLSTTAMRNQL